MVLIEKFGKVYFFTRDNFQMEKETDMGDLFNGMVITILDSLRTVLDTGMVQNINPMAQ